MARYERALFVSDFHAPYQDLMCVKTLEDFSADFKPKRVFIMGDLLDFYQLSKFDKDPERMGSLQADIDSGRFILERIRTANPKAQVVFIEGNHEHRLQKWVWNHPEVASLRALSLDRMLDLERLRVAFVGSQENYLYHNIVITHGEIARKFSGYSAKGQIEMRGMSGISGHTHRLGSSYRTDLGGDAVWFESGCMCTRKPQWIKAPDWQNGLTYGEFNTENDRFQINQLCITDGKCVHLGREYGRGIYR